MKKLLFGLIAFASPLLCAAQISLEHTYNSTSYPSVVLFSANGEKYCTWDSTAVYLYNMDHSLWKTIHPNMYTGYTFSRLLVVSDHLFNSDDLVEYVAVYYPYTGVTYKAEISNETGTVLQSLGGASDAAVHYNSINGNYKLLTHTPHFTSPMYYSTDVYSVPGTIPCGQCGQLGAEKVNRSTEGLTVSAPVPNPSGGVTRINYTMPQGTDMAMLTFYNAVGERVRQLPVFSQTPYIDVNTSTFKSGTYLYNISAENIASATQTLIVK